MHEGGSTVALKDLMGRNEPTEPTRTERPPAPAPPPRPAPTSAAPSTFLDASITFSGELRCGESLRIDGKIQGEIHCDETVVVGRPGVIHAKIEADSVVIAGEVHGDIDARRKITLESTARVIGDLCTPGIVIQEGAKLEGRIVIGDDATGRRATSGKETRKPAPAASAKPPPPPPPPGS
jgi:cytoskeletal protein CcmA (bactofilin family)